MMIRIFKPNASPASAASPSTPDLHWSWVSLIGPDAQDFLHRLTTVNVRGLGEGEGKPGFFLTAQGKVRSYFTLWNYRAGEYAFEFEAGQDDHWKKELLTVIDQYTFGEKITLADVTGLEPRWIFPDPSDPRFELKTGETVAIDEEIRICHHGDRDFGRDWLTVWGRPGRLEQWIDLTLTDAQAVSWDELETWRILANRPRPGLELTEATIPLEVGLADGISENKGCYPGQEVIERIVALGSPARRLSRIDGEGQPPNPGETVLNLGDTPAEVGAVTSVSSCEGKFSALALIKKIHAKEGLPVRFSGQPESTGKIVRVAPYA